MSVTSSSPAPQAMGRLGQRKGRRRFSPWMLLTIVLIIAVAGAAAWQFTRSKATTTTTSTATVSQGSLSVTVSGSGTVEPAQSRALAFPVSGTVSEVLVDIGDTVTAGQALARLDTAELEMAVQQAEANLKSAQATYAAAHGEGATEADIAAAQAQLRSAQASLSKTRNGDATAADIASAEAQLESAQASLATLLAGPTADDLSSAQTKVEQAQLTLQSQRTSLAAAKAKAASAVTTAANNLRDAQDSYSTIYWQNRELEKAPGELSQTNKDNEAAALRAVNNAEESYKQAQLAYEQARLDEVNGIAQAESSLSDDQAQLNALTDGATDAEIASARASVASAQASLDKLREPATAAEITVAEASVEQAQINLDSLTTPGSATTIASAEANLAQAQIALEQARQDLEDATLVAPFAGVVSEVGVSVGDSAGTATTITVIDPSTMYVDLSLSESDVANVAAGQAVTLSFDALPDISIEGVVDRVAPTATVSSNVATYPVRISFKPGDAAIKIGMTASGIIKVEDHADAILVPTRAIQTQGESSVVQVQQGMGQPAKTIRVETGLSSDGQTEIVSCVDTGSQCLQAGDTLLVTSTTSSSSSSSGQSTTTLGGMTGGPPDGGMGGPPPGQ